MRQRVFSCPLAQGFHRTECLRSRQGAYELVFVGQALLIPNPCEGLPVHLCGGEIVPDRQEPVLPSEATDQFMPNVTRLDTSLATLPSRVA